MRSSLFQSRVPRGTESASPRITEGYDHVACDVFRAALLFLGELHRSCMNQTTIHSDRKGEGPHGISLFIVFAGLVLVLLKDYLHPMKQKACLHASYLSRKYRAPSVASTFILCPVLIIDEPVKVFTSTGIPYSRPTMAV